MPRFEQQTYSETRFCIARLLPRGVQTSTAARGHVEGLMLVRDSDLN